MRGGGGMAPGGRRRSGALLGGLLLCAGLACGRPLAPAGPDLVVVSIDTLRADRLGLYGAARATDLAAGEPWSPRWLAERGTVFEQCWAPAGKTIPSLASLWTGREPLEHGAVTHLSVCQGPTFAEDLRAQGWRTFARGANASVEPAYGIHRGFEDYALRPKDLEPRVGEDLLELAAPVVRERGRLLLWAHYMAPHQPYEPPPEDDLWADPGGPQADNETLYALHRDPARADAATVAQLRARYDGEVHRSARLVAAFLAGLDRLYRAAGRGGLLANAVVVFTADHGEELGDRHGYFLHAKSLFSGVLRVPLVIAGPGWPAGERRAAGVALADVVPLALGRAPAPRRSFVATWQREFWSIRDERWTLIHHPCGHLPDGPWEPPYPGECGRYPYPELALFDRRADPLEQVDVAAAHPQEAARLLQALGDWLDGLDLADVRSFPGADPALLEKLVHPEWFAHDGCRPRRVE